MIAMNLHKILNLYETSDEFYLQPVDKPNEALIIDRQTGQLSLSGEFSNSLVPAHATLSMIYGIIGIKHLGGCPYLIVITAATKIGLIDEKPIYRLDRARLVAFDRDLDGSNGDLVSMMESFLETPHFYFSYEYNLTNSLQRNCHKAQSDQRFLWNGHMMVDSFDQYRVPLILGFVSINPIEPSSGIKWTLISRRSVKRAGTRFNCRGIDGQGNVANFVETEHILEVKSARLLTSFVQVRGSIPLTWSQRPDYRYKPAIKIDKDDGLAPMKRHFDELIEHYDRVSVVNLIDSRGHEGELEHEFSQRMAQVQQYYDNSNYIPYHYFDFHKECAKMRWHRLDVLLDRIESEIQKYGFFVCQNGSIVQNQSGIIRSNCIDSLDRTNVIQSMIAGRVLLAQEELLTLGMLSSVLRSSFGPESSLFKNVWADNADTLSIQYAGTPALKTDFTRTGRRTYLGQLQDGLNSATRYVTNNFYDQYRQDAIDLFLGLYAGPSYRSRRDLTAYTSKFYVTTVVLILVMLYFYLRH